MKQVKKSKIVQFKNCCGFNPKSKMELTGKVDGIFKEVRMLDNLSSPYFPKHTLQLVLIN